MELAPKAKPLTMESSTVKAPVGLASMAAQAGQCAKGSRMTMPAWTIRNAMKRTLIPINPSPTTDMPMTAPPEKATARALFCPCWAAAAVRTLAFVATVMPMYPASIELAAPYRKATAVDRLICQAIAINNTKTNIAKLLYSRRKKAIAPS